MGKFFNKKTAEANYGIITLDGEKQAIGAPFWDDPYKPAKSANKKFLDIAMKELEKDANIFMIDEIGDR